MVPVSLCIKLCWVTKCELQESVRWVTTHIATLALVCSRTRISHRFSFIAATEFSDICRISTWRETPKHHGQIRYPELLPSKQPDPHSFLDCCRSTSSAILTPQYIVIAAQKKFHPPTTPCHRPPDQPRDAARREECSDLDEKSFNYFCRCDGRAKGIC